MATKQKFTDEKKQQILETELERISDYYSLKLKSVSPDITSDIVKSGVGVKQVNIDRFGNYPRVSINITENLLSQGIPKEYTNIEEYIEKHSSKEDVLKSLLGKSIKNITVGEIIGGFNKNKIVACRLYNNIAFFIRATGKKVAGLNVQGMTMAKKTAIFESSVLFAVALISNGIRNVQMLEKLEIEKAIDIIRKSYSIGVDGKGYGDDFIRNCFERIVTEPSCFKDAYAILKAYVTGAAGNKLLQEVKRGERKISRDTPIVNTIRNVGSKVSGQSADRWNPSDIYLIHKDINLNKIQNFEDKSYSEFNEFVFNGTPQGSRYKKEIMGFSLKASGGKASGAQQGGVAQQRALEQYYKNRIKKFVPEDVKPSAIGVNRKTDEELFKKAFKFFIKHKQIITLYYTDTSILKEGGYITGSTLDYNLFFKRSIENLKKENALSQLKWWGVFIHFYQILSKVKGVSDDNIKDFIENVWFYCSSSTKSSCPYYKVDNGQWKTIYPMEHPLSSKPKFFGIKLPINATENVRNPYIYVSVDYKIIKHNRVIEQKNVLFEIQFRAKGGSSYLASFEMKLASNSNPMPTSNIITDIKF